MGLFVEVPTSYRSYQLGQELITEVPRPDRTRQRSGFELAAVDLFVRRFDCGGNREIIGKDNRKGVFVYAEKVGQVVALVDKPVCVCQHGLGNLPLPPAHTHTHRVLFMGDSPLPIPAVLGTHLHHAHGNLRMPQATAFRSPCTKAWSPSAWAL